jgi:hypothetical protein
LQEIERVRFVRAMIFFRKSLARSKPERNLAICFAKTLVISKDLRNFVA